MRRRAACLRLPAPGERPPLPPGDACGECLGVLFFPLRVTEPWPRLPREAVESPSLEIFQPRLDKVLCSLL